MPETLPIACAINAAYALPLGVLLKSLKRQLRPGVQPVLYLIHTGIPESILRVLSELMEVRSIVPPDALVSTMPYTAHYPRETAFPLLLADCLPDLERVLFLDVDLLVMDDLMLLWQTPLEDYVLAAAPDFAIPLCSSHRGIGTWRGLGIPPEAIHFNGGVMMIHLERWRQRQVTQRVLRYCETNPGRLDFLHQEAMNAVLWNDWQRLDSRWNLLGSYAGRQYDTMAPDAWKHPGIVHFAGRMKPWRFPIGGPFNTPYREVLDEILPLFGTPTPNLRDKLFSIYDRKLRDQMFPLEQLMWRLGWL